MLYICNSRKQHIILVCVLVDLLLLLLGLGKVKNFKASLHRSTMPLVSRQLIKVYMKITHVDMPT